MDKCHEKSCEHYFKPCPCIAMYCTKSYCMFCGMERQCEMHPELKAILEHEIQKERNEK